MTTAPETTVGLTVTARKPGRPPMERVIVDLALQNSDARPLWFLLPNNGESWSKDVSVDGVEPVALGDGAVVVGTFQGTGGFVALKLASGAKVLVHGLELTSMKHLSSIVVRLAHEVTVGGKPAQSWFPRDPTSKSATVHFVDRKPLASKHTPTRGEVKVSFDLVRDQTVLLQ